MRIVVADDEYLVRSSLISMLQELNLSLDFVGEATNGEDLVALVRQALPDVAFVDIRMPTLSGLEAIRAGKMISPQTRWFILTGFSEFEYAQEAIRLGVSGYLVKPVNPDELRKVFGDLTEENQKRKIAQNKQFERELIALWYGLTSTELEESDDFFLKSRFIGAVICLDSCQPEKVIAERHRLLCREIRKDIEQKLDNHNRMALFILPGGELATVGAWESTPDGLAGKRVWEYFRAVDQACQASGGPDLAVTMLLSKECPSYTNLQEQLDRLQKLASLRAITGIGKKVELAVLNDQADKPGRSELGAAVTALSRGYQERNYLNYVKNLAHFEKLLAGLHPAGNSFIVRSLAEYFHRSIGCLLPTDQVGDGWIQILQRHGERMLKETSRDDSQGADLVNQVIAFIDQNYMRDISIGQIAEQLNITPNYLSTLFHKKTGTNFMNYLKKIRMLRAKELLTHTSIQVQQVAEQVGYFSARHFARLFAEYFGCLPSEYRDRNKRE